MNNKQDSMNANLTLPQIAIGFAALALFIVVAAFIFSSLGIDPPKDVGPLPWMAN